MIIVDNLHRDLNMSALLPQMHECEINRDPCEPGRETAPALEVLQVQEGPQERLLKHILCILPILYDAICPAQDLIGVAFAELDKGNSISRLRSRDQQVFAHLVQATLDGKIIG
jgi:hypothetical protein